MGSGIAIAQVFIDDGFVACRYPPRSIGNLTYHFEFTIRNGTGEGAMRSGAAMWNISGVPAALRERQLMRPYYFGRQFSSIIVYERQLYNTDWLAQQSGYCQSNHTWRNHQTYITFNRAYFSRYNDIEWAWVGAHEIGHSYGIAHVPRSYGCSVMNPRLDLCSPIFPTQIDINLFNSIYSGW